MLEKGRIADTCGVHNLHGMPAILSALFSAVFAFMATKDAYGDSLYHIFPAMKNSTQLEMEGGEHEHIIGVRNKKKIPLLFFHDFNAIINFTFFNITSRDLDGPARIKLYINSLVLHPL